jgi:tRNA-dihydrouridine synthase
MRYYFAPLEGITDRVFRDIHHRFYPGIDRYYTPFLSPTIHRGLTQKEQREIPPADTLPYRAVPQILTKNADDFLWLAQQCLDLGYNEVNLNLGCPSGTVTAKGKGSGMLRTTDILDQFLDSIFNQTDISISVKTRIGFSDPDEFPAILDIYNRYPICELIIHPRIRNDFYNGEVNIEAFQYAVHNCKHALCYNGDITNRQQIKALKNVDAVMIGRGLIANPGLLNDDSSAETLQSYLNALLEAYIQVFGSDRNAMFRLKEHWHYLQDSFIGCEKYVKQLRKTTDVDEFFSCMSRILMQCPFQPT